MVRRRKQVPNGLHVDAFGDRVELTLGPGPGEIPTIARGLCLVGYSEFDGICPLCVQLLPPTASGRLGTGEHVPPFAVGGSVLTRTCPECNGRGASAEADLAGWWAKEFATRFETSGLPGFRNAGKVLLRATAQGRFALIISGPRAVGGVHEVLARAGLTNEVTGTFAPPTGDWRIALLKSAYLAACLHLDEIPHTPDARYARDVLRSGSWPADALVGVGQQAVPFRVFRRYDVDETEARSVWIGVATMPSTQGSVPIFGIALGAVAFVTWPLPDLQHRAIELATTG